MDKKLWVIWKCLSRIVCLGVLVCYSNSYANNQDINCDLTILVEHPIKECSIVFEKQLAVLSQQDKQFFEAQLKNIESTNTITKYEDYAYLFKKYPTPKVLFNQLQLDEQINKELRLISYDSPECCMINQYINTTTGYDIIIAMLENKHELKSDEKAILQVSKQRSHCLHTLLNDLANNPEKTITSQEITKMCFQ